MGDMTNRDIRKLGWQFGDEISALSALRGCLASKGREHSFQIGWDTLYDALLEYSEARKQRDEMLEALQTVKLLLDQGNPIDPEFDGAWIQEAIDKAEG